MDPLQPEYRPIETLIINPDVAASLAELCDESKPMHTDSAIAGTLNEEAAGDDQFCRWAVVGLSNGHWQRFKVWLTDFEAENQSLRNIKDYYFGIIQDMEKINEPSENRER